VVHEQLSGSLGEVFLPVENVEKVRFRAARPNHIRIHLPREARIRAFTSSHGETFPGSARYSANRCSIKAVTAGSSGISPPVTSSHSFAMNRNFSSSGRAMTSGNRSTIIRETRVDLCKSNLPL